MSERKAKITDPITFAVRPFWEIGKDFGRYLLTQKLISLLNRWRAVRGGEGAVLRAVRSRLEGVR